MATLPSDKIQSREVVPFIDMEFTSIGEKQTARYSREIAKSVYSYYINNKTELSWDYGTKIDELRLIGQGRQSVDYYKRYYSSASGNTIDVMTDVDTYFNNSADANRYGWMNVIWDNLSPIANVKQIAKAMIKRTEYDMRANVVDLYAMDEEDRRMIRHYAMAKYKDTFDFLRGKWGLPMSQNEIITDEYSELLDIKRQGGFKAHFILGMEQLLKWTEDYSDWDDHLKERFFDDIFDTRYGFAEVNYDKISYKPKWRWVDVKDVIIQTSATHDFSDSDYRGYFDYPTINELRKCGYITDGEKALKTKEDWLQLGKIYADYMENPSQRELSKIESDDKGFSGRLGSVRVCRLNLYWKDYEKEIDVEYSNRHGGRKRRAYKQGEPIAKNDKLIENRTEKIYYCQWIVGTDWMISYGPMENMPRKNLKEAVFPLIGVKMMEKSYTERLTPLAHMFAIAWIRLCNSIAKAQNDFYYLDINALAEITDGDKKLPWDEIIRMMKEENILLGDSSRQAPQLGGTGIPVQKIPGTLLEDMTKEMALMDQMYAKIEQLIGLPPVALGVSPETKQAVRTTQMSVSSSNTALNLLIAGVMKGKKLLGLTSCSMWQNAIKYNSRAREEATKVIGSDDVQGILDMRDEFMELGISLEPRPSDQLKENFLRIAEIEVGRKNQGQSGIDSVQFMWLQYHFETGGSFLEALYRLQYWKRQDEKRVQAEKEAAIKQQGQVLDQNARTAAEEDRKTEAMKDQQVQRESQAKIYYDSVLEDKKHKNEIEKIKAEWLKEKGEDPTGVLNRFDNANMGAF